MIKVTLRKCYTTIDFIFRTMQEASNFIETVLVKSEEELEITISKTVAKEELVEEIEGGVLIDELI